MGAPGRFTCVLVSVLASNLECEGSAPRIGPLRRPREIVNVREQHLVLVHCDVRSVGRLAARVRVTVAVTVRLTVRATLRVTVDN